MSTLADKKRETIRRWANGESYSKIAKEYNVLPSRITDIISRFFIRECLGWKGDEETMRAMIRKALENEHL